MNAPITEKPDPTTLIIRRTFDTDIQTLWRALTDPQSWIHWFGGGHATPVATSADVRPGGAWQIEMRGNDTGNRNILLGEYVEVTPPRHLSFTWTWHSAPERVSQVSYALSPAAADSQTVLILTHQRFADADARDSHGVGWGASLEKLAAHLTT